jgi:hypothetical protein
MPASKISTKHNSYSPRIFWCWTLIVLFIFSLFRLPGLGVPLASDELATVSLWAQMPYLKILSNYQYPNNHIFLSLVLSFLLKTFGLKEWLLRMPLLVCGIISICQSYYLGRRLSRNATVGLFTAFLMAICEKHIFYSTNARGYLVIMVLALLVVTCLLNRLEGHSFKAKKLSNRVSGGFAFLGWTCIWLVGTWTVPTFLFFEVSVAILILVLLLARNSLPKFQRFYLLLPLTSCVAGSIGFYFQYFVLIDSGMLAHASLHAAKTTWPQLLPGVLSEWIKPFELASLLLSLFVFMALRKIFQQNKNWLFLLVCVWLGPIIVGCIGFFLEKLPGLPHPRTFFYLQPFFIILGVIGAREAGVKLIITVKRNYKFHEKNQLVLIGIFGGILLMFSGLNFFQNTYPERKSREPLDEVHDFIKTLKLNDLLLVSKKIHVELYLYGARSMRDRLENILHSKKLGNIYYLNYEVNNTLRNQGTINKEVQYLKFHRLIGDIQNPILPKKGFILERKYGSFKFYRLKQDWLQKFSSWERAGLQANSLKKQAYSWETISNSTGIRPLIWIKDSFSLAMQNKVRQFYNDLGFTLNLVDVSDNNHKFAANLLEGFIKDNDIVYNSTWSVNPWVLDHPFGSQIFGKVWNPAIFISQGSGNVSVLQVHVNRHIDKGALRNFLSYRIEEPGVKKK